MTAEKLQETAAACAERHGAHLIDVGIRGEKGTRVLEVFVDAEEGITTDRCAEISRDLLAAIEGGGLVDGAFRLDVSSPGIQRPLKYPWQYLKHVGRKLEIRLDGEPAPKTGILRSADQQGIVLEIQREMLSVPFARLIEVRVKSPW